MASPLQDLITQVQNLATDIGNALQLRGFKRGGTTGQVPVKTDGTDFNWAWGDVVGGSSAWDDITGIPAPVTALSGTNTGDQDLSGLAQKAIVTAASPATGATITSAASVDETHYLTPAGTLAELDWVLPSAANLRPYQYYYYRKMVLYIDKMPQK